MATTTIRTSKPKSLRLLLGFAAHKTLEKVLLEPRGMDSCQAVEVATSLGWEITVTAKKKVPDGVR